MNIGKAFSYVFEEDEWYVRLGIGGLLLVVPVLSFAAIGYELETARNVYRGAVRPLPTWSNLGHYFQQGLTLGLARLVYAAPIILGTFAFIAAWIGSIFVADSLSNQEARTLMLAMFGGMFLFMAFIFGCSLLLSLLTPAITLNYLQAGTFAACFDFRAILGLIRQHPRAYFTAFGLYLAAGWLASAVVGTVSLFVAWIPCIGTLIYIPLFGMSMFWTLLVHSHFLGQLLHTANITLPPTSAAFDQPSPSIHPEVNSGR